MIRYYKMRGRDGNAAEVTWRTWVVRGTPDPEGRQYIGPFAGTAPKLEDITISAQWEEQE